MKVSFTGVIDTKVQKGYFLAVKKVCAYLNERFDQNSLKNFDLEISFCPVILGEDFSEDMSRKSQLNSRERVLYLCPKVDFSFFYGASLEEREKLLLQSFSQAVEFLMKIGATTQQVNDFAASVDIGNTAFW